ncbi:hypothetical protein D3C73_908320 [compost metagenome]
MFLVVMEADVAAIDMVVVFGSPSTFPATALTPICPPIVGLYAMFGIRVIGERLLDFSFLRLGWIIRPIKSDISYWLARIESRCFL